MGDELTGPRLVCSSVRPGLRRPARRTIIYLVVDDALPAGAYSELVTETTEALLAIGDLRSRALVARLRGADAGDRLGAHIGSLVARLVGELSEGVRAADGAAVLGRLIDVLAEFAPSNVDPSDRLAPPPR